MTYETTSRSERSEARRQFANGDEGVRRPPRPRPATPQQVARAVKKAADRGKASR